MDFQKYDVGEYYDELFSAPGAPRPGAKLLAKFLQQLPPGELRRRQAAAEQALYDLGITFTVYGHEDGDEKIFPFDVIPRIVPASDWLTLERGLKQRITALNLFLQDIYNEQRIIKDGVIPRDLVESAADYHTACKDFTPPQGIWCHITGTDLVRGSDGQYYVLEDNLRCPSGVSYVLANRHLMKRTFPEIFPASKVQPVDSYAVKLLDMLHHIAPSGVDAPLGALLTPGAFNSAYFEHSFLAQQTGLELAEGRDLVVKDGYVHLRTTRGLQRVHVLYRRINDDYLDPKAFRPESVLGVPGIMEAYRNGRVSMANAPGTGVADDKVIYAYVPEIIKYYLAENVIVPNVETFLCWKDTHRQHVLANLETMVVKAANESGGYGMLVGPSSTKDEREEFARRINASPRNYIAQPTVQLSRVPVIDGEELQGRHVDLRPYIIYGEEIYVLPGGLTRVALRKGSLVVNSSQGGGSKDTWVLSEDPKHGGEA